MMVDTEHRDLTDIRITDFAAMVWDIQQYYDSEIQQTIT